MNNNNTTKSSAYFDKEMISKIKSESMRNYLRSLNRILESNSK